MDSLVVLTNLLEHRHELVQFEAAMGLTNLLTLGEEAVKRCVQAEGWYRFLDLIGGDEGNPMLARAGLEGLCNLTQSTEIRDRIRQGHLKTTCRSSSRTSARTTRRPRSP